MSVIKIQFVKNEFLIKIKIYTLTSRLFNCKTLIANIERYFCFKYKMQCDVFCNAITGDGLGSMILIFHWPCPGLFIWTQVLGHLGYWTMHWLYLVQLWLCHQYRKNQLNIYIESGTFWNITPLPRRASRVMRTVSLQKVTLLTTSLDTETASGVCNTQLLRPDRANTGERTVSGECTPCQNGTPR